MKFFPEFQLFTCQRMSLSREAASIRSISHRGIAIFSLDRRHKSILEQRLTHMGQQCLGREGLKEDGGRRVGHAVAEKRTVRIAGDEEYFHFRASRRQLLV